MHEGFTLKGHESSVMALAFSQDGRWLASASENELRFWDLANGRKLRSVRLKSHEVLVSVMAFSPDGRRLARALGETVELCTTDGKNVQTLEGHTREVQAIAFSPDGGLLASSDYVGVVRVWDTNAGEVVRIFESNKINVGDDIKALAFSSDGRSLVSGDDSGIVRLWDLKPGENEGAPELSKKDNDAFDTDSDEVPSPDGRLIARKANKAVQLLDTNTRQVVWTLAGHEDAVERLAFSLDGRSLATIVDKTVRLWGTTYGNIVHTLEENEGTKIDDVVFSPDGRRLAIVGRLSSADGILERGFVRLLDPATGLTVWSLEDDEDNGLLGPSVTFSPDGRRLAYNAGGFDVSLLDAANGETLTHLRHFLARNRLFPPFWQSKIYKTL